MVQSLYVVNLMEIKDTMGLLDVTSKLNTCIDFIFSKRKELIRVTKGRRKKI